jgi:hypothetical protein
MRESIDLCWIAVQRALVSINIRCNENEAKQICDLVHAGPLTLLSYPSTDDELRKRVQDLLAGMGFPIHDRFAAVVCALLPLLEKVRQVQNGEPVALTPLPPEAPPNPERFVREVEIEKRTFRRIVDGSKKALLDNNQEFQAGDLISICEIDNTHPHRRTLRRIGAKVTHVQHNATGEDFDLVSFELTTAVEVETDMPF